MKIIISPAKKMNVDTDTLPYKDLPVFMEETEVLMQWMRALPFGKAKGLWGCSEKIAEQNYKRFQEMDLHKNLTPAILSYEGIQYQYMAPSVFHSGEMEYIQEHLRILSGFYGVLKPFDGVTPYRLEMQTKAGPKGDLYSFWGERIYKEIAADGQILNLASKEYSKCVEKYLGRDDIFVTCIFGELTDGKVKQKGTLAKMARGEMVRFMAEKAAEDFEALKGFDRLGYQFDEEHSTEKEYVFLKERVEMDM